MKTFLLAGCTGFILLCSCGNPAKQNTVAAAVKNQPADSISLLHADSVYLTENYPDFAALVPYLDKFKKIDQFSCKGTVGELETKLFATADELYRNDIGSVYSLGKFEGEGMTQYLVATDEDDMSYSFKLLLYKWPTGKPVSDVEEWRILDYQIFNLPPYAKLTANILIDGHSQQSVTLEKDGGETVETLYSAWFQDGEWHGQGEYDWSVLYADGKEDVTGTYVFAPKVDNSQYPEDYKDDTPKGELTLKKGAPGEINFTIEYSSGYPDYGSVQLEGTAQSKDGGKTYVYDVLMEDYGGDDQEHCYILFKVTSKGIDVDNHNTLACGGGEHSNFEGLYLKQDKSSAQ